MYYKGIEIDLNNYQEVFKVCSPDILDEIRSAILDDVNIVRYINGCGDDNYKLGQIRMALRENIPSKYLSTSSTGDTIKNIRYCAKYNIDLEPLEKYIEPKKLNIDAISLEKITEGMCLGASIREIDFRKVKSSLVPIFMKGLVRGYPMEICEDCQFLTEDYVITLMKGMALDIDILPFITNKWSVAQMVLIFSYSSKININEILGYISNNFDYEVTTLLLNAKSEGLDIENLCYKDEDGFCIYNEYQIDALLEGKRQGINYDKVLYDPKLSDEDMLKRIKKLLDSK